MSERLTDEQVAEALRDAAWALAEGEPTDLYRGVCRAFRQVLADLSAAKASEEDRRTWLSALGKKLSAAGFKREDESLMGMAEDALKAFSALQEKAREAVEALAFPCCCGQAGCGACQSMAAALSALRSLLPEEHEHRFITDDDGAVHPCVCGAAWAEEVK